VGVADESIADDVRSMAVKAGNENSKRLKVEDKGRKDISPTFSLKRSKITSTVCYDKDTRFYNGT
jgi:hypothetical protein